MQDLAITTLEHPGEFRLCQALQRQVWGMPDVDLAPLHVFVAAVHAGGLVLGAWMAGELVGFTFSFAGHSARGTALHHSHMTAVLPTHQGRGVGFALKRAQARRLAARGVELITWTFDPLQAGNANFNLNRLGAIVRSYLVDFYGEMADAVNQGTASDRFEAELWLHSPRVQMRLLADDATSPHTPPPAVGAHGMRPAGMRPEDAVQRFEALWRQATPQPPPALPADWPPSLLVEIPPDFQRLKQQDAALAAAWRAYLRAFCQAAFAAGYAATALHREPAANGRRTFYFFEQQAV